MKRGCTHSILWLAILLPLCVFAFALDPSLDISQYAHSSWRSREGFSKGAIFSIAQTPDGYLWLGTESGLLRFDGVRAVPWQLPSGQHLPSNSVPALLSTRDGTLWIGTTKGLASWKAGKLTQYPQLAGLLVNALVEDHEGTVWAGGFAYIAPGKLCAIHTGTVHCYGEDGSLGNGVLGLYEDAKGSLWAGVLNGFWLWKSGPAQFYPLVGEPNGIQNFAEDRDGTLLIPVAGRVAGLTNGKIKMAYPYPVAQRQVHGGHILRDHDGGVWVGTLNQGLVHVHEGGTDRFAQTDGLSGDLVTAILEDREGSIWVSTTKGLDRFSAYSVSTFSERQGMSSGPDASVVAARDGSVWFSARSRLDRWNKGRVTIYREPGIGTESIPAALAERVRELTVNGLPTHDLAALFQDDDGRIWVAANGGVGYFQNDHFVPVNDAPGGVVYAMAGDEKGNLWISNFDRGLLHLFRSRLIQQIPWAALGRKDMVTALAADRSQGGVWLGFSKGGIQYLKDGQLSVSYTAAAGLGEGRINDIQFDHEGVLWTATEGGLSRLKDGRIATLTMKQGLPCDKFFWLAEDSDLSLWLFGSCGLVRIARSELDAWAGDTKDHPSQVVKTTLLDRSDGVSIEDENRSAPPSKSPDGRIWFPVIEGLSVFDPRRLQFNQTPPPVHIEQIIADRKTYDPDPDSNARVRLPSQLRDLQIDYTALSFVTPEKVLFRYKLEGWDGDWRDAGTRRQAFYADLPPRNYTFRVRACNNSGVWNEAGTSVDFVIPPAWYQKNWFRAVCVIVLLALLWALYRWRIHRLRIQEKRLRDVVDTIPAMAFVSKPDGYRTFVNKVWVEYTGMTLEQSLGSGWHAAIHPADLKQVLDKWEEALATEKSMYYEARYRRAEDGQYRWFMVRVVGQRDKRGKIVKWFGTVTDIEERKRAEHERERLRQLEDDMAHINRVTILGEMAASLAHEIKQPLAAAINSANSCIEWLAHEPPNLDRARAAAKKIDKYNNRAAEIIERIRSLYKKSPPQRELVDVNEIIQEMLTLLKCEADRYSIDMRGELAPELPQIVADRVQLQQVFMNLFLNGIEAMTDSGGELMVKSQRQDAQLLFSVSDTGVGLPPEKAEQIFSAFFTTKPQGSGMGLAISRSIVESHGGQLWASASDGRGATFHFSLPIETQILQETDTGM